MISPLDHSLLQTTIDEMVDQACATEHRALCGAVERLRQAAYVLSSEPRTRADVRKQQKAAVALHGLKLDVDRHEHNFLAARRRLLQQIPTVTMQVDLDQRVNLLAIAQA